MADAWKVYISNMEASGLQICGIFGLNGQPYSLSDNLPATQQEMASVVQGLKSNNFTNGVVIGGKKYTVINCDPTSLTAKCRVGDDGEKYLVHLALTNTLVVLGGISGPNERSTTTLVENIVSYLKQCNY